MIAGGRTFSFSAMLAISPHTFANYYWWMFPALLMTLVEAQERRPWAWAGLAIVFLTMTFPRDGMIGDFADTLQIFHLTGLGAVLFGALLTLRLTRDT